jgi:hypothetical protein
MGNPLELWDEDKPCILYTTLTSVLRQELAISGCWRAGIRLKDTR